MIDRNAMTNLDPSYSNPGQVRQAACHSLQRTSDQCDSRNMIPFNDSYAVTWLSEHDWSRSLELDTLRELWQVQFKIKLAWLSFLKKNLSLNVWGFSNNRTSSALSIYRRAAGRGRDNHYRALISAVFWFQLKRQRQTHHCSVAWKKEVVKNR